ncbi:alcohol dehydrogenase class IV [Clostridium algifaecis]|uniref:Alcohol dehydrogenase class IV n=1 Tax=Clostridium algifaecis TaxID=1472040 RepID=A0ABS4KPV9_9CLOT|nr:alcohol dehydrogenase class IV [Clostridium algifaecis]
MISKEYYQYFIDKHACDDRFIRMAKTLGMQDAKKPQDFITMLVKLQETCRVADLKMSGYGIQKSELEKMATNARKTMGGLFMCDPCPLSHEDCVKIYEKSYK